MRKVLMLFLVVFVLTALFYVFAGNEHFGFSINGQAYDGIAFMLMETGSFLIALAVGVGTLLLFFLAFTGVSLFIVFALFFLLGLIFAPVLLPGLLVVCVLIYVLDDQKADPQKP